MPPTLSLPLTKSELDDRVHRLVRKITGDSLGIFTSSAFAVLMPWMAGSAAISLISLIRDTREFTKVRQRIKDLGQAIRFKDVFNGVWEGTVIKLITSILTLGHDDYVALLLNSGNWLQSAANGVGRFTQKAWGFLARGFRALKLDTSPVLANIITDRHIIAQLANMPTEQTQKCLGIDSSDDLDNNGAVNTHGWRAPGRQVAEEVVIVGSVEAVTEKGCETLVSKPIHSMRDRRSNRHAY